MLLIIKLPVTDFKNRELCELFFITNNIIFNELTDSKELTREYTFNTNNKRLIDITIDMFKEVRLEHENKGIDTIWKCKGM